MMITNTANKCYLLTKAQRYFTRDLVRPRSMHKLLFPK